MSKLVLACKKCHTTFKIESDYRKCGNLGCTEYNKRFGGKLNVSQSQKRHEEKKEKDVT
tara:strand:- start:259 stop:435 length:177 start_codon:yes stop_codon:yes gene_type:complete